MKSQPQRPWLSALRFGLIGGGVAVLLALVGMVEVFSGRSIIGGVLSLGQTLLAGTVLWSAASAARKVQSEGLGALLLSGGIAGAMVGALLAALVIISTLVDLRPVFINASSGLFSLLTFGQSPAVGVILLILFGLILGLATSGVMLLAPRIRRLLTLTLSWVVLIGLLADLIRLITDVWGPLAGLFRWLFSGKGLSIPGTLALVVIIILIDVLRERGLLGAKGVNNQARAGSSKSQLGWMRLGLFLLALMLMPIVLGTYMSEVLDQVGLSILMGLGLNIVVGFAGLLDLGYVAFYAIGAYTMGVLTSPELGFFNLNWWVAAPIAVGMAVLAGVLLGIPVLKMRGDYLAIVTLGFGEIIRLLAVSDWLRPYIGGAQGIQLIAKPAIGSFVFNDQQKLYYLLLAGCLLAAFISIRLRDSRLGRAWMAMREDEDVAQAMGINLVATKLLAFATGAAFSGLSGAIFAAKLGAAYPNSFGLLISINVLALIIIGGMGSIPGVIVGAMALTGLPELLREFAEFRLMVYGAVLVVMMLYRPEGLWPEAARRRELHEDMNEAMQPAEALKTPGGAD